MHFGLSARAPDPIARLHARPAAVGEIARKAEAKRLVLSHFMEAPATVKTPDWFSLFDLGEAVGEVRKHFSGGRIDSAVDLQCIPVR
jgi:ribonuclease BN (tRNA processing enzyme)